MNKYVAIPIMLALYYLAARYALAQDKEFNKYFFSIMGIPFSFLLGIRIYAVLWEFYHGIKNWYEYKYVIKPQRAKMYAEQAKKTEKK